MDGVTNWYEYILTELERHYVLMEENGYSPQWTKEMGYDRIYKFILRYADTGILACLMDLGRSGLFEHWNGPGARAGLELYHDPEGGDGYFNVHVTGRFHDYEHYSRLSEVMRQEMRRLLRGDPFDTELGDRGRGDSAGTDLHLSIDSDEAGESSDTDFSYLYAKGSDGYTWINLASSVTP